MTFSCCLTSNACIADAKQHMRMFLAEKLEELGLASSTWAQCLFCGCPTLFVIESSAGGIEECAMMGLLAAKKFDGKVVMLGPRL